MNRKIIFIFISLFFINLNAATLPKNIKWVTNTEDVPYASPDAKIGGVLKDFIGTYPQTFRLYGPNSSSGTFVIWSRSNCFYSLVSIHPQTFREIPMLATHWAIMPDNKTVYYKLDKSVRWNDGTPVTADDYVFAFEFFLSPHLKEPFYNSYYKEKIKRVEKIDDYTIVIEGTKPSWRILSEYDITPIPKHATVLDENWVKSENWKSPVCIGPYTIDKFSRGRRVRFKRIANWWGDNHKFLKHTNNFEYIDLKIINNSRHALEYFKRGELSYYSVAEESVWRKDTDFDEVKNGWIVKRKVFVKKPSPVAGIFLNLRKDVMKDKNFRKALQHLLDFEKINKNVFYSSYFRIVSFFGGSQYENTNLKPYYYNPELAEQYLKKAGWIKRGSDGILVNSKGERCSFTISYGRPEAAKYLDIYKQDLLKAGVDAKLELSDGAKIYKNVSDKTFDAVPLMLGAGYFPAPDQYFHSKYAKQNNNNNFFSYSNQHVDDLIKIYENDLLFNKRKTAMQEMDSIIQDEAFFIPYWYTPYYRILYHNNLSSINNYEPLYAGDFNDSSTWWFDPEKDKILKEKKKKNEPIKGVNDVTDVGPYLNKK